MSVTKETLDRLRIDRSSAPRHSVPLPLIVLLCVVVVAVGVGAWWLSQPRPIEVRTRLAEQRSSGGPRTLLNASGYVTARRQATVSSKVTGKIVEVLVEEGMEVDENQVLARLDATNVERSLQLAEAQLQLAQARLAEERPNLERAERDYQRILGMAANNAASEAEVDTAEADVKSSRARTERLREEVEVARREVSIWKQQVEDTVIRAPFAGVVTSKDAQPGEMISPMSSGGFTRTGICTIVDMSSLEIEVDVSESYINRVQAEMPVVATLDSYPNWQIPAQVIAIIPAADRQKATVRVRVGFDQLDPRVLPDMSVKVAFQSAEDDTAEKRVVVVPEAAVRQDESQDIVWVVADGIIERRAVTVQQVVGDQAVVSAGLTGGERVVVEESGDLADGVSVVEGDQ